jgi:peptidoglycan/xylan/chitin deacetylase (PgdA/CDA1 family)
MKVALRDDDTSFFTAPEQLEAVYHDVWDRIPVSLAVVPRAAGFRDKAIPERYWQAARSFPLEENAALVEYLRTRLSSRRVTIGQHGYTHEDFPGGAEFQAAPDIEARLAAGRADLERLLGTRIRIFVPPHNALSKRGLAAVSGAGLNLLGSFLSFRPSMRPWDRRTPANYWRVRQYRRATGRGKADRLIYPHVLRYSRHAEFGCHGLIPGTTVEQLVAGFEEARRAGGDFCVATHYWEVDAGLKRVLLAFLDYVAAIEGVELVAAERLFDAA